MGKGTRTICQNPQLSDSRLNLKKKKKKKKLNHKQHPPRLPHQGCSARGEEEGSFTKAMVHSLLAKGAG